MSIDEKTFQMRVREWMNECFGERVTNSTVERNYRFLEEALELVQANGLLREEALELVAYTYGRDIGSIPQEVGGVMVTLAGLCNASNVSLKGSAEAELVRINEPGTMLRIQEKQKAKPFAVTPYEDAK